MRFEKRNPLCLLFFIAANFVLQLAVAQNKDDLKTKFIKGGIEYSVPGNKYGGCDYKVSGVGIRAERQWQQSKKFSFLLASGYQYFKGYTVDKSLGKKDFSFLYISAAERLYPLDKLFVQAQAGLSTWGPVVSGGLGYQARHFEAGISYRTIVVARAAQCYKYPNEEHLNFTLMLVL